jgi:uncharacterized delta-60 repeat protein
LKLRSGVPGDDCGCQNASVSRLSNGLYGDLNFIKLQPAIPGNPANDSGFNILNPEKMIMKRLLSFVLSLTVLNAMAQDGMLDLSFDPGTAFNNRVEAVVRQPDGKIIAGGNFTMFNGTARKNIARLNADGSLDLSFNSGTGFNGSVLALALQPDGKVVAAGSFTAYNGSACNRIVRLNADGSLDATFNTGSGFDFDVITLALQADGKIVAGGSFTSFNGGSASYIVRLNSDGSRDSAYSTTGGFDREVFALAVQNDGKILAGGIFNDYRGSGSNTIARLNADGTLDASFMPGIGFEGEVRALAIQTDGKIIAGGDFTAFDTISRTYIARLNANGSLDTGFASAAVLFNNSVEAIAVQSDGKIVAGGAFETFGGISRKGIARLSATGTLDPTFDPQSGFTGAILAVLIQPDGKILAGGDYSDYNGTSRNNIARLKAGASRVSVFQGNASFSIFPNPTNGNFSVDLERTLTDVKIVLYDLTGKEIFSELHSNAYKLDLHADFPAGIYFLKIICSNGETATAKLVKE